MYDLQSSSVTIPKAMLKSALGALQTWKRASFFFHYAFDLAKHFFKGVQIRRVWW